MNWYEAFDFDENPFNDTEETKLFGYEQLINDILYNIDAGNMVFVEAEEGAGKTALLWKAIHRFKGDGRVAYIDCVKISDPNIEHVIEGQGSFWGKFMGKKPRGMIILMDNVNELSQKNTERIKYFYDQNYIKSIVFTGRNIKQAKFSLSLHDRIKEVLKVPKVGEEYAHDILKDRLKDGEIVPRDAAQELFKKSQKNIKKFLENSEEILKRASEQKKKSITIADVKEFLGDIKEPVRVMPEPIKEVHVAHEEVAVEEELITAIPVIKKNSKEKPHTEKESKTHPKHAPKQEVHAPKPNDDDMAERYY